MIHTPDLTITHRKARYIKSELFQGTSFKNKKLSSVGNKISQAENWQPNLSCFDILEDEKTVLEESLVVIQSEASAYDEFIDRFPNQHLELTNLRLEAMNTIANLVGRINAVTNMLSSNSSRLD